MLIDENLIRGSCELFVCRCCRTKYGWAHQVWCDTPDLLEPGCGDCRYFDAHGRECIHPALRKGTEEFCE